MKGHKRIHFWNFQSVPHFSTDLILSLPLLYFENIIVTHHESLINFLTIQTNQFKYDANIYPCVWMITWKLYVVSYILLHDLLKLKCRRGSKTFHVRWIPNITQREINFKSGQTTVFNHHITDKWIQRAKLFTAMLNALKCCVQ